MLAPLGALAEGVSPLIEPECPNGKTGPSCQWTCEDESECGFTLYRDGDGGVVGVRAQGAILAKSPSPGEDPAEVFSLQMESGAEGLVREVDAPRTFSFQESAPPHPQGGLLVRTFSQSYRGIELLPSASQVRLVYSSRGLVRISGRLVNNAVPYTNATVEAPFGGAAEAIADAYRQRVPGAPEELDVRVKLVAIPELEEVGVLGVVRDSTSSVLANVVVEAAPNGPPRILLLQEFAAAGLV